jgi:flagellar hook protein FlgE
MLRSLFSGVTGMKSNQVKMDVIGNNIANVNTTGFKAGRVTFKDMLSQTIQTANAPSQGRGGMNPKQVGLGVAVAGIDTNMSQGGLQPTSRATDMAIEGNGFYIVSDGNETRYTRDGAFTLDKQGNLITADGYHIMGIINGNIPTVENGKKLFYAGADDSNQKFKDIAKNTPSTLKDIVIPLEAVKSVSLGGFNISLNPDTSFEGYKFVLGTVADGTAANATVDNVNKIITIDGDFTSNGTMIDAAALQAAIASKIPATETVTVGGATVFITDVERFEKV